MTRRPLSEKGRVPLRYWAMWAVSLAVADLVFYVVLTPFWLGARVVAWTAEFRARRAEQGRGGV